MSEAILAEAAAADYEKGSAASKPKSPAQKPAAKSGKKEKEKDPSARIMARIRAAAPRKGEYGTIEISQSSKAVLSSVKYVITTGIDPFDDLVGAFPVGRITEVYGLEASGKSQLAIRTAVRGQTLNVCQVQRQKDGSVKLVPINKKKAYIHVLYVDNEQSIDSDEKIVVDGVKLDVQLARCDTIDQLFKMADISIAEIAIAQKEDPDTLYLVLIIADTITATSCNEEMTQQWGKQDYSRLPKQLKEGFRRLVRRINRVNVAMICTNQVGDNMKANQQKGKKPMVGGLGADDFTTAGGRALKFFASHRVFMKQLREYKINPKSKFANGLLIGFRSMKNRVKKPYREGRMVLLFGDENGHGGGFSNDFSILETLIYFKYAEISDGEKKEIKFKFAKHKIKTATFEDSQTSTTLDEDDDKNAETAAEVSSRRGKKDPFIEMRAEWPAFYAAHKADIDALYQAAITQAFADEHVPGEDDEEISDEDEFEEDEV